MNKWPKLCILLLTFNRPKFAEKTLRSILENLSYSGEICVHIADDGTGENYRLWLAELVGGYEKIKGVSISNSERKGYGANYNAATQQVHQNAEIVLPLEDDWEMVRPLDIDVFVEALQEKKFGCIRMGYLGHTQDIKGNLVIACGHNWMAIDPNSSEPHVFAGHPRLETIEWEKKVGPWPEGLEPGQTEFQVCHIRAAREGIVWPIDFILAYGDLFAHIGCGYGE